MSTDDSRRFLRSALWRGHRQPDGSYRGGLRQAALVRDGYQCRMCLMLIVGKGEAQVDHIVPRSVDPSRAADLDNLQTLCASCHSRHKQSEERTGRRTVTIGPDGWPVDTA